MVDFFRGQKLVYLNDRAIKFHGRLSLLSIDLQLRIYSVSNTARFGLEKFLGYLPSVDGLTIEIGVSLDVPANCVLSRCSNFKHLP